MGITVFFLICGPFAALLYFPLTTRQRPRPAHVRPAYLNAARHAAQSQMAVAQEFQSIRWSENEQPRNRKNAA
jgi:hypothetical protein